MKTNRTDAYGLRPSQYEGDEGGGEEEENGDSGDDGGGEEASDNSVEQD
jgi:hypothetical protein